MKAKTETSNHLPVGFGGSDFFAWISAPPPDQYWRLQAKSLFLNITHFSQELL